MLRRLRLVIADAAQVSPGRWTSVPLPPGTAPIPRGMVRRFHVSPAENIPTIEREGLTMEHAKGIEGPLAIYSWTTVKDAVEYGGLGRQACIVEFWDDPRHYDANPVATTTDVPPSRIVAIHQGWHEFYRGFASGRLDGSAQQRARTMPDIPENAKFKRAIDQFDQDRARAA